MRRSREKQRKSIPQASGISWRRLPRSVAPMLAVVIIAVIGFGWSKGCQSDTLSAFAPQAAGNGINQPSPATAPSGGFERLTGHWQRPDGGYIIEIQGVEPGGKMNAAYFNPNPINVAKAEASRDSGSISIFIELKDLNYPGSTYTLTYDPVDDSLKGTYFQAALKQTFDVYFMRLKI